MTHFKEQSKGRNGDSGKEKIWGSSRPKELPPRPLTDTYMKLSLHTAPIVQSKALGQISNGRINEIHSLLFVPTFLEILYDFVLFTLLLPLLVDKQI